MPKIINLGLMSNPLNWLTLALWLFTLGLVLSATGITTVPTSNSAN